MGERGGGAISNVRLQGRGISTGDLDEGRGDS